MEARMKVGFGRIAWDGGCIALLDTRGRPNRLMLGTHGRRGTLIARLLNGQEVNVGSGLVRIPLAGNSICVERLEIPTLEKMPRRTIELFFEPD